MSSTVLLTVEELEVVGTDLAGAPAYFANYPKAEVVVKDGAKPCTRNNFV